MKNQLKIFLVWFALINWKLGGFNRIFCYFWWKIPQDCQTCLVPLKFIKILPESLSTEKETRRKELERMKMLGKKISLDKINIKAIKIISFHGKRLPIILWSIFVSDPRITVELLVKLYIFLFLVSLFQQKKNKNMNWCWLGIENGKVGEFGREKFF